MSERKSRQAERKAKGRLRVNGIPLIALSAINALVQRGLLSESAPASELQQTIDKWIQDHQLAIKAGVTPSELEALRIAKNYFVNGHITESHALAVRSQPLPANNRTTLDGYTTCKSCNAFAYYEDLENDLCRWCHKSLMTE